MATGWNLSVATTQSPALAPGTRCDDTSPATVAGISIGVTFVLTVVLLMCSHRFLHCFLHCTHLHDVEDEEVTRQNEEKAEQEVKNAAALDKIYKSGVADMIHRHESEARFNNEKACFERDLAAQRGQIVKLLDELREARLHHEVHGIDPEAHKSGVRVSDAVTAQGTAERGSTCTVVTGQGSRCSEAPHGGQPYLQTGIQSPLEGQADPEQYSFVRPTVYLEAKQASPRSSDEDGYTPRSKLRHLESGTFLDRPRGVVGQNPPEPDIADTGGPLASSLHPVTAGTGNPNWFLDIFEQAESCEKCDSSFLFDDSASCSNCGARRPGAKENDQEAAIGRLLDQEQGTSPEPGATMSGILVGFHDRIKQGAANPIPVDQESLKRSAAWV